MLGCEFCTQWYDDDDATQFYEPEWKETMVVATFYDGKYYLVNSSGLFFITY